MALVCTYPQMPPESKRSISTLYSRGIIEFLRNYYHLLLYCYYLYQHRVTVKQTIPPAPEPFSWQDERLPFHQVPDVQLLALPFQGALAVEKELVSGVLCDLNGKHSNK